MAPHPVNSAGMTAPVRRAFDVFNGDADGICALHQLRLAHPANAQLITGVKRDIELLQRIPCEGETDVTVLDVSLDANVSALRRILDTGGRVTYFDHHSARLAFQHQRLQLFLDEAPDVCSSILVDRHLNGQYRQWAVTAAFGDNLTAIGRALAQDIGLSESRTKALAELGLMLNYNAYGEKVEDLHIAPDALYRAVHQFIDPQDFIDTSPCYCVLADGFRNDAARMANLTPDWQSACGAIYILPNAPWARRISGVFANQLISQQQARAYAVLTENTDGSYVVSVRSADPAARAANGLCERFPGGGGRKAAAGINRLPANELDKFIQTFSDYFTMNGTTIADGTAHAR